MVPWVTEDGGGGMLGGVDRGCVFTSAGESGIAAAFFSFLSAAVGKAGGGEKRKPVKQAEREGDQQCPPPTWCLTNAPPPTTSSWVWASGGHPVEDPRWFLSPPTKLGPVPGSD